ncbi:hypothetical protein ACFWN7_10515 [Agromyces sp. NPDC058484]|uniref:hypothetical protein n=1 Tax=Agromyces sp. NPDC058484 TaxID=3346524 RepID=UPI00364CA3C5
MTRRERAAAAICAGMLALGLAGCTGAGATPMAEADPSTPAATQGPSATPTPTPTPPSPTPVAAEPASCDTVLTEAGYADLAGSNLSARDFTPQSWDYPLLHTMSAEGVVCLWGNSGDVMVVLGQLPMEAAAWESTRAQLAAEGYVQRDDLAAEFMDGPDLPDASYPGRGFVYRDGILYYVSYSDFLTFVAAFAS